MSKEDKLILAGVISAAHGIRGDIIIKSYTDPLENIFSLNIFNANHEILKLKKISVKSSGLIICKLDSCGDRNKAESLKGTKLYSLRSSLPALEENEYYYDDLKNKIVINESGKKIGIIQNIMNYGAGDIIEIKFNDEKEELLPFTRQLFPQISDDFVVLSDSYLRINE